MSEENALHPVSNTVEVQARTESPTSQHVTEQMQPRASKPGNIKVRVECDIDLALLRKQKSALYGITEGAAVSYEQEGAVEGMLNLLHFIQDAILEQGLATEEEISPRLPQLFDQDSASLDIAA